jgi:hypothetical protein
VAVAASLSRTDSEQVRPSTFVFFARRASMTITTEGFFVALHNTIYCSYLCARTFAGASSSPKIGHEFPEAFAWLAVPSLAVSRYQ